MVKLQDVVEALDRFAPPYYKEDWDNVGLHVGRMEKEVKKVFFALTPTQDVLLRAKAAKMDLVITHHPLIFKGLKALTNQTAEGRAIYTLIENDMALFCAHTNFDATEGGVNDILARYLKVTPEGYLEKVYQETYYKLVVYVPSSHFEVVREALFSEGAGKLGEYSECSWKTYGEGSFRPSEKAKPFVASEEGERHYEAEVRFEVLVGERVLKKVIEALLKNHPYEVPAYDLYKLEGLGQSYGIGKIGSLLEPMGFSAYASFVKESLGLSSLKVVGEDKQISRVAFCGGSGASFIKKAASLGADCYLTGDLKYHDAQLAQELGLNLIDITHFNGEKIAMEGLKAYLKATFKSLELVIDTEEKDFFYLV